MKRRITEDRKGRLLETIWQLNDRFLAEDDDALEHMFNAVTEFAQEAAADERDRVVVWLRNGEKEFSDCDIAAHLIEQKEHLA